MENYQIRVNLLKGIPFLRDIQFGPFLSTFYRVHILLFICGLFPVLIHAQDSLWTQKSDMRYSRWHLSANEINGKIYVIGGVDNYTANESYDIATDTWQSVSSLPTGRGFVGSGVVNGKIYIIGGTIFNEKAERVVEKYDPLMDTWTTVESLGSSRFGMGSCVYNNKIYIFGGNSPAVKTVEVYDPASDEWEINLQEMPTARWEPECVLVDNQIYVIGGFLNPQTGLASADVEAYDPETDSWTVKASLPEKRGGGAVACVNDRIYYFGGSSNYGSPKNNLWVYDPDLDEWFIAPEMPDSWFLMSSCTVNDTIYLVGGSKVGWPHNDGFKGLFAYIPDQNTTLVKINSPDTSTTGVQNNKLTSPVVYPNPASNLIYLDIEPTFIKYRIIDLLGKTHLSGNTGHESVNLNNLRPGRYFIEVIDNQGIKQQASFLKL